MDSIQYLRRHYFNYGKGWDQTNPGWYTVQIDTSFKQHHDDMVQWLYDKLDNPEKHCVWTAFANHSCFRFRYEKDFLWFRLTW